MDIRPTKVTRPSAKRLRIGFDEQSVATPWRGHGRAQQIVDAAMEGFHRFGFGATTMDDIARMVGIEKPSLYYYVDSKDDLLYLIVRSVRDESDRMTHAAVVRADLTPLERLLSYVRCQVDYNANNALAIAVYHHEWRQLSGEQLADIERRRLANLGLLKNMLRLSAEAGELLPGLDLDLALRTIIGIAAWPYTWYQPDGPTTPEQLADFCKDFVLRAIAAQPVAHS